MAKETKEVKISKAKGRPMLTWVGKRPITKVKAFPAQHVEHFEARDGNTSDTDWSDWPDKYPRGGLLFHGDNRDVLAHLLANGFRGKVKLIYIDPPFDSGADYVRKVELRGAGGSQRIDSEEYTIGEQIQYTDIWTNDNYLQFVYERLLLLKELLSTDGTIYVHCNSIRGGHIKVILDEVFGSENFINEITWHYYNKMAPQSKCFPRASDKIISYAKHFGSHDFEQQYEKRETTKKQLVRKFVNGKAINARDENGNVMYRDSDEKRLDDVWRLSMLQPADKTENLRYPTQKPEALIDRMVKASSSTGDIILDCFIGSGTIASVAQKNGRRWIGCDINKGAIQTTSKRMQSLMREQLDSQANQKQGEMLEADNKQPHPAQLIFNNYRVNDYDLQIQHNEAVELACEHIGVTRTRADHYFDGTLGNKLVKMIPFNHPLTPLDLEDLREELHRRPEEERDITIVCLGIELSSRGWLEEYNRARPINKAHVIELRTDQKYGGFIKHEPLVASVNMTRKDDKLFIEVTDVFSPTIIQRLNMEQGVFRATIEDWRAVVDCIMVDINYNGNIFNVALTDVPATKQDLVEGSYELEAPPDGATVAVKVVDMLGEEAIITKAI